MTRSEKINLLQAINIGQANIESLMPKESIVVISMDEAEQKANEAKIARINERNKHRAPDNQHHVIHLIFPPGD
jgi:hypothetical protein